MAFIIFTSAVIFIIVLQPVMPSSTSSTFSTSEKTTTPTSANSSDMAVGSTKTTENGDGTTGMSNATGSTDTTISGTTIAMTSEATTPKKVWFRLAFSVKIEATWDASLSDTESSIYEKYERGFQKTLTDIYNDTGNGWFHSIEILGFYQGSIECRYIVTADPSFSGENVMSSIRKKVLPRLQNATFVNNTSVNVTSLNFTMEQELAEALKIMSCKSPSGETYGACVQQCEDKNECGTHGQCKIDTAGTTKCSCTEDDDYVYTGPTCSEKVEKLALTSVYIIGIAAGGGGGLVLILIVALVCTCYFRRRQKIPKNMLDNYSFMDKWKDDREALHGAGAEGNLPKQTQEGGAKYNSAFEQQESHKLHRMPSDRRRYDEEELARPDSSPNFGALRLNSDYHYGRVNPAEDPTRVHQPRSQMPYSSRDISSNWRPENRPRSKRDQSGMAQYKNPSRFDGKHVDREGSDTELFDREKLYRGPSSAAANLMYEDVDVDSQFSIKRPVLRY